MASLTHPLRVMIIGALEREPLGPSEFHKLDPTNSLPFIRGHFRTLEKLGYIERVAADGGRRIRFRPAQNALFFDVERLRRLGAESSHDTSSICITYAERIAEAFGAGTFSSRPEGRFMWTDLHLDESKWRVAVRVTDALFWFALRLHDQAARRLARSGEDGIPVTTGFSCTASPARTESVPVIPPMTHSVAAGEYKTGPLTISQNMARALAHPVRARILGELRRQPMGPAEIRSVYDGASLVAIAKHCIRLEEFDLVRRIRRRSRPVYGLKSSSLFAPGTYGLLPLAIRNDVDRISASTYIDRIADSILAGTIQARLDSHLTWTRLRYDETAIKEMARAIDAVFVFVLHLQQQSEASKSDLVPVTLGYGCFQSPAATRPVDNERLKGLYTDEPAHIRAREVRWVEDIVEKVGNQSQSSG